MKKFAIAGIAALAIAGSTAVYAQHRPWFHHPRAHERGRPGGFLPTARIAAVKAGLKLTPDQEKTVAARSRPRCGISRSCGLIAPNGAK